MPLRYSVALALTLALTGAAARTSARQPAGLTTQLVTPAAQIYSRRALRRARIILQLKLLELRRERLERVRKALEHHAPIEQILNLPT
jgi:hypothetical protein